MTRGNTASARVPRPKPDDRSAIVETSVPPPAFAETHEIAPGIFWVQLPLPMALPHVNVWLLRDGDAWTIVDCGADTLDIRMAWDRLLTGILSSLPVRRIIVTHGHVDHIGYAGPLSERVHAPVTATRTEWMHARLRRLETGEAVEHTTAFYRTYGATAEQAQQFVSGRRGTRDQLSPLPSEIVPIRDGDTLTIGGRVWHVMTAGGHAPEHASLWCPSDGILIAGDQILPRISPTIGVMPTEPEADPLRDYLASLDRFEQLREDSFVLPSHGVPFHGLQQRIRQLREHHGVRLGAMLAAVGSEATAVAVAEQIFRSAMQDGRARLAFAETLSHLNRLVGEQLLARDSTPGQPVRFRRQPDDED